MTRRLMIFSRESSLMTCLVVGQREDAVIDGPQRDLASRRRAARVADVDVDLRLRRGPVLVAVRLDRDLQPFRGVDDLQLRVAEAERRLARVAGILGDRVFAAAFDEQHGDEDVRDVFLGDRDRQRLLRRSQLELLPGADAFALRRQ